ncbi:MAG: iron-containing redox enzyme family protein [Polyangiaceae bacterium]|nr:iron-containing redox enzyme family protein [Polyangiaceae bacterium]MCW5791592.1 iron-containing redox enzyme family protein [Polyangiaceae bacterium]
MSTRDLSESHPGTSNPHAHESWDELGRACLEPLANAAHLSDKLTQILDGFRLLTAPWGRQIIGDGPSWNSDVCSDHSVFEPSVAFTPQGLALRVLVEAQGAEPNITAQAAAGVALTRRLGEQLGFATERCERLQALFLDEGPGGARLMGRFGIWHALEFYPAREEPSAKVYFDLSSWGRGHAAALTEEALCRMDLSAAWPTLGKLITSGEGHELAYFSIDLDGPRVKIYLRHRGVTGAELERVLGTARGVAAGSATRTLQALGAGDGPYDNRPLVTSLTFGEDDPRTPAQATLYFPIESYAANDSESLERLGELFDAIELPREPLQACVTALRNGAGGAAQESTGVVSYVSYREEAGQPRSTVYFSPRAFSGEGVKRASTRRVRVHEPRRVRDVVAQHERWSLVEHPYFRRLRREPVSLERLWLLMANFERAIIRDFPRRLASLTARAPTDEIRAVLADQLHDELGRGDFSRAHKGLFAKLMRGIEAYRSDAPEALSAAAGLSGALELEYVESDPWFGVGASLLVEVFGMQVDCFINDEFARQAEVSGAPLEWLKLHSELEVDHAGDSVRVAAMIPEGAPEARAVAGAEHISRAASAFFSRLYEISFPE